MAMHTELWFPTVIWSAMSHTVDNDDIKHWIYEKQKTDKGRVLSNYGGWQSNNIQAGECPAIDKFVAYLDKEINECAIQTGLKNLEIKNIWANINPPGAYNWPHKHKGSVFSGVYYVDATDNQGNIIFQRTDGAEEYLPTDITQPTYFNSSQTMYRAKTGALYIFPGWALHAVEGNLSKNNRISLSFNYGEKR